MNDSSAPVVAVRHLHFRYDNGAPEVLTDITLDLAPGERHLLVGANGSGKTTLLRVIAGKHMVPREAVRLWDRPAFHDTALPTCIAHIGGPFRVYVDITVEEMLERRSAADPNRVQNLIDLLSVDVGWHMHRVSAGQRRRVQLLIELSQHKPLLLLDEVTSDLDVVVRADLLEFLKEETTKRGSSVLYATHVFDGLEDWATHLTALEQGRIGRSAPLDNLHELTRLRESGQSSPLYRLVERWIRQGTLRTRG